MRDVRDTYLSPAATPPCSFVNSEPGTRPATEGKRWLCGVCNISICSQVVIMCLLTSTMTSHGRATRASPALVEELQTWEKDESRRIRNILLASSLLYLMLELFGNMRIIQALISVMFMSAGEIPNLDRENLTLQDWRFDAGLASADTTAVVLGLAALIFTINIAVFAARFGAPKDIRGDVFLARWQGSMEELAPLAAAVSFAFASTRIPTEASLGLGLLLVSAISIRASNVRIAGRLSAIAMEVATADILSELAAQKLSRFRKSLPPRVPKLVRRRRWVPAPHNYSLRIIGMIILMMLLQAVTLLLLIVLTVTDQTMNNPVWELAWSFAVLFILSGITTAPAIGALVALAELELLRRTKSHNSGHARAVNAHAALQMAPIVAALCFSLMLVREQERLMFGLVAFTACVIPYILIRVAIASGRGPGVIVIHMVTATLVTELKGARRRADKARDKQAFEKALHRALDTEFDQVPVP